MGMADDREMNNSRNAVIEAENATNDLVDDLIQNVGGLRRSLRQSTMAKRNESDLAVVKRRSGRR